MKTFSFLCTFLVLFLFVDLNAQQRQRSVDRQRIKKEKITQRFSAGLIAGLNFSQLDGDDYTGFDKKGFTGGIKLVSHLSNYVTFDVEFLYTQKGAKIENELNRFRFDNRKNRIIAVDYVDVPLFLKFFLTPSSSRLFLELGGIASRKIGSSIQEQTNEYTRYIFKKHEENFNTGEFSLLVGGGYALNNDLSVRIRANYGITKLFYDPDPEIRFQVISGAEPVLDLSFLRNYSFSIMVGYNIF